MDEILKSPPLSRLKRSDDNALGVTETTAAKLLGVSRRTIRVGIDCGDIRTVTFARRRFIPRAEIDRIKRMFLQR
jgi:excisionase family DNA binding protein